MSSSLVDLFLPYGIPPSPLHCAVQEAARQAGWTPPLYGEQLEAEKSAAGKQSGAARKARAEIRRFFVKTAFDRLKPGYRMQPFSDYSIDALEEEYRGLLAENGRDPVRTPELLSHGIQPAIHAGRFW